MVQYLSQEKGREHLEKAKQTTAKYLKALSIDKSITVKLYINPKTNEIRGENLIKQQTLSMVINSIPPTKGYINYFPADRSLPNGEINIQIGAPDFAQQLKSHIANPTIKHQRLKNTIVNHVLMGNLNKSEIDDNISMILSSLLEDKTLAGIKIKKSGRVTVDIKETKTNAIYDIDNMSSGEKGLLLTFFQMIYSSPNNGIVLLDEPELHLNPSVCKKILPFLSEKILNINNLQVILCTHSPEILSDAYEMENCELFHLLDGSNITPIKPQDKAEVHDALKRLGASTSDILFSKGSLFVEGPNDVELLEHSFNSMLTKYKIIYLNGRKEIEKEIEKLKKSEEKGELEQEQCFLFDNDRTPTTEESTNKVKIKQWDRYCFENYLIASDPIYDIYQERNAVDGFHRGNLLEMLKEIAFEQIYFFVACKVYNDLEPDNPGIRSKELLQKNNYSEIGNVLAVRLEKIKNSLSDFEKNDWIIGFESKAKEIDKQTRDNWDTEWLKLCDGKKVIREFYNRYKLGIRLIDFQKQILMKMKTSNHENFRLIRDTLNNLL